MTCARPSPSKSSALISDVGGTLLTEDKSLTARAQAAVAELRASGIAIISSRPPWDLRTLLELLGITTPVRGFNGRVPASPNLAVITEESVHVVPTRAASAILLVPAQVDGTLVTAEKGLTLRARTAVKALRAAGVDFAITTGRPPRARGVRP
jgi:hydroxymethylpyrimidine pyrophosphatase-like HAD family hydrolase